MYGSLKKIHIVWGKIYINNMHFLKATKHDNCDASYEPLTLYANREQCNGYSNTCACTLKSMNFCLYNFAFKFKKCFTNNENILC